MLYKKEIELFDAIKEKDIEKVKELVKQADLNMVDTYGASYISRAVQTGNLDLLKILVENGANINPEEISSHPLHLAIEKGFDMVKYLIDLGADPNKHFLSACWYDNVEIVKMMLEKGADINQYNKNGGALHFAIRGGNNFDMIDYLLESGIDINLKDEEGRDALFFAIEKKHFESAEQIVKRGGNINTKNAEEKTAFETLFQNALSFNSYYMPIRMTAEKFTGEFYLKYYQEFSDMNKTALAFFLVARNRADELKLLVESGLHPSACIYNEKRLVQRAIDVGQGDVIHYLLDIYDTLEREDQKLLNKIRLEYLFI